MLLSQKSFIVALLINFIWQLNFTYAALANFPAEKFITLIRFISHLWDELIFYQPLTLQYIVSSCRIAHYSIIILTKTAII